MIRLYKPRKPPGVLGGPSRLRPAPIWTPVTSGVGPFQKFKSKKFWGTSYHEVTPSGGVIGGSIKARRRPTSALKKPVPHGEVYNYEKKRIIRQRRYEKQNEISSQQTPYASWSTPKGSFKDNKNARPPFSPTVRPPRSLTKE